MIRITLVGQTEEEAVLKIEGSISGEEVVVLATEGERHFQQSRRLVLDLAGVQFIDNAGIRLLQMWSGGRLVLRDGSLFVRTLLETYELANSR